MTSLIPCFFRFLFILGLLQQTPARAGSGAHGGHPLYDFNNPWNVGSAEIPVCIETENHNDHDFLVREVKSAVNQWQEFFAKYKIDERSFVLNSIPEDKGPFVLATRFFGYKSCKELSPENIAKDNTIAFKFSKTSPFPVDSYSNFNYRFGFAVRRGKYDSHTLRNGGDIWVRLDEWAGLSTEGRSKLRHVLLHEIGHVFGMPLNSVWVMDEDLSFALGEHSGSTYSTLVWPDTSTYLGQIESPSWVYKMLPGTSLDLSSVTASIGSDGRGGVPEVTWACLSVPTSHYEFKQISYLGVTDDGAKRFSLSVQVENCADTLKVEGFFDQIESQNMGLRDTDAGPYLYLPHSASAILGDYPIFLDSRKFALPAHGFFLINQTKYPAIIENDFGVSLRIFDLATGVWFRYSPSVFRDKRDPWDD